MSIKDDIREAIQSQHRKIEHWRTLFSVRDDRQDEVADAIDEARDLLDHLRRLRKHLEDRHQGWTEAELHDRRQELADAIYHTQRTIDDLITRLQNVKDAKRKARRHLHAHQEELERLQKKLHFLQTHDDPDPPSTGPDIVTFDGLPCADWIATILRNARASGVWAGGLISGVRSPQHSQDLCFNMCGAPSCPGTCAGTSSNHCCPPSFKCVPHEGAADVTDPAGLERYCIAHGAPLHGNGEMLPADLNHFSYSGR